jgi:hypothetical protein
MYRDAQRLFILKIRMQDLKIEYSHLTELN